MTNREITDTIEEFAPLSLQESWDNSGWQLGAPDATCSGVILCVDVTPDIIREAKEKGCNLIVSHHPLMFKGVKQITGRDRVERSIASPSVRESRSTPHTQPQTVPPPESPGKWGVASV